MSYCFEPVRKRSHGGQSRHLLVGCQLRLKIGEKNVSGYPRCAGSQFPPRRVAVVFGAWMGRPLRAGLLRHKAEEGGEVKPSVTLSNPPLYHRELSSRPLSASGRPDTASVELLSNSPKAQAALLVALDMGKDRLSKRIGLFLVRCRAFPSGLH